MLQNEEKPTEEMTREIEMEANKFMREAIRYILTDDQMKCRISELKSTSERSGRGEHVFNVNILKFHTKVEKKIKKSAIKFSNCTCENISEFLQQHIHKNSFLDSDTKKAVREMVVNFDVNEVYINYNSVVYGIYIHELTSTLVDFFENADSMNELRKRLNRIIDGMNKFQVFVDFFAQEKWIMNYKSSKDINTNSNKAKIEMVIKNIADYLITIRNNFLL